MDVSGTGSPRLAIHGHISYAHATTTANHIDSDGTITDTVILSVRYNCVCILPVCATPIRPNP